jgi:hypothetical protein
MRNHSRLARQKAARSVALPHSITQLVREGRATDRAIQKGSISCTQRTSVLPCAKCIQPIRSVSNGVITYLQISPPTLPTVVLFIKKTGTPLDIGRMGWMHFAHGNTGVLCIQDMLPYKKGVDSFSTHIFLTLWLR